VQAVACDVSDPAQHLAAFQAHMAAYGRLDYALLNAGISERGDVLWCGDRSWQATLDVDLRAVIDGVGFAARAMLTGDPQAGPGGGGGGGSGGSGSGERGVIMVTASAGGIFPMPLR
jgi:NAD(P)-dependent dehydrogenase (short-subunit alcohol dehydrogenase family)